jgi:2'-5' RNA ligase
VYETAGREFVPHIGEYNPDTGEGKWKNYLTLDLAFEPIRHLRAQVENRFGVDLSAASARGDEAHITIITPPEYWGLHPFITMDEIIDRFGERIQKLKFKVLSLGEGTLVIDEVKESAYFVIIEANEMLELRREIYEIVVSRGGSVENFDPDRFYPHITVGFTKQDIHIEDGLHKDESAKVAEMRLVH